MIIVNADDFGLSHDVNSAIVEAFKKGYINRTTIMVNMPGFDEAVKLAKENGFFDRVGLHFNIFEGQPLIDDLIHDEIFYTESGNEMTSYKILHTLSKLRYLFLPRHTKKNLKKEFLAQAKKYKDAGFTAMHFDSHGHAHVIPSVYFAIKSTAKKSGFVSCRKSLNLYSHKTSPLVKIYKSFINFCIDRDFNTSDYFCALEDYNEAKCYDVSKVYEIMVHPIYDDSGKLVNRGRPLPFTVITDKFLKTDKFESDV